MTDALEAGSIFERVQSTVKVSDLTSNFLLPSTRSFTAQYNKLYLRRLNTLRPNMIANITHILAENHVHGVKICERLVDASPDEEVIIIGTLYKDMPEKPCVLDELEKDPEALVYQQARTNFCTEKDSIYIEDEYGRIQLVFSDKVESPGFTWNLDVNTLVSGVLGGFRGHVDAAGDFNVTHAYFLTSSLTSTPPATPKFEPSLSTFANTENTLQTDSYIAFLSDLQIGVSDPLKIQFLADFLTGLVGTSIDHQKISYISTCILAGNSIERTPESVSYLQPSTPNIGNVTLLDQLVAQIASSMSVYILPGINDPSNFVWPQQALHPCLFPKSCQYNTFHSLTNPCWIEDHLRSTTSSKNYLITDGRNINDIRRFSSLTSIEALESSYRWGIIVPTAPDTVGSYPFQDTDPYIMHTKPDIYAAGSQDVFDSKIIYDEQDKKYVLLLSIPSFTKTNQIILVNPSTLDVVTVSLPSFMMDDMI